MAVREKQCRYSARVSLVRIHYQGSATSYSPHAGVNLENGFCVSSHSNYIVAGLLDEDADCMHAGVYWLKLTGDSRHAVEIS